MDLSAYADFSVVLDYSTGQFRLTDTSTYPAGVALLVNGSVEITQPDGLVTPGSFSDVSFSGSALTVAVKELRNDYKEQPQNGTYSVKYTIRADGYEDTVVIRNFTLTYKEPYQNITKALNVFTPQLSLVDSTSYVQSGLSLQSVQRSWDIVSAIGTTGGVGQTVNVSYDGQYYDALYTATLEAVVEYDITSWATIIDKVSKSISFQSITPPTISDLRDALSAFKQKIDDCNKDTSDYEYASSVFQNFLDRGRSQDYDGLIDYVLELQKIFAGGYTPVYENTNAPIPAYDWGAASPGSVDWADILNKPQPFEVTFRVGQQGFPASGASVYANAQFAGRKLIVNRNGIAQWPSNPGDGDTYYEQLGQQVTFYGALSDGEKIHIIAL